MTQVWRFLQQTLSDNAFWLNRLVSFFGTKKHLHTDRFATDHEVQSLTHDTSFGLVLGLDRFERTLCVEATKERRFSAQQEQERPGGKSGN
jgi:hypothetical protein